MSSTQFRHMLWSSSPDGAVDFVNQRCGGFRRHVAGEDFSGWNWQSRVHPDDRSRFVADWVSDLKTGRSQDSEVRVRRADGEYRWFLIAPSTAARRSRKHSEMVWSIDGY